ncbi:MAG: hypothetical protein WBL19_01595 [Minisyncoccia bacterium]
MNTKPDSRAKKMARRVMEFYATPEGKKALQESQKRMKRTHELLAKGREIDPEELRKPFTI